MRRDDPPTPTPTPSTRAQLTLAAVFGAAAVATLVVTLSPGLRFAYRAPELHAVLETSNAVIALLVGFLFLGRHRRTRSASDLLLALSLCTVAVANLVLTAVPNALSTARGFELTLWAPVAVRFFGTVLLAAAAVVPTTARVRSARRAVLLVAAAVAVATASALLLGDRVPPAIDPGVGLAEASRPLVSGHPVLLAVQGVSALLYGMAAVAFTRRGALTGVPLLVWVGRGCAFAALARVNYLLFPSLYTDFVYTGDVLRLAFYGCLLVGAVREISSYWQAQAHAAVLEDRRRMARDLHDGLSQELAYIWSQSRLLVRDPADTLAAERVSGAAGRALDEARRAIAALTRPLDEPFPVVLQQLVEELAGRYDVAVDTHLDEAAEPSAQQAEGMLRIAGEAIRNAVVHGRAGRLAVSLTAAPLGLSVHDDGGGFDPARTRPGGFGLVSMRERAEAMGATLAVASAPGRGADVRLEWS